MLVSLHQTQNIILILRILFISIKSEVLLIHSLSRVHISPV
jgi:hypothetical protein